MSPYSRVAWTFDHVHSFGDVGNVDFYAPSITGTFPTKMSQIELTEPGVVIKPRNPPPRACRSSSRFVGPDNETLVFLLDVAAAGK